MINKIKKNFDKVFAEYDFLVVPTTAGFAPRLNQAEKNDTCLIWTTWATHQLLYLFIFQKKIIYPMVYKSCQKIL